MREARLSRMKSLQNGILVAVFVLTGCASNRISPSNFETAGCTDLNNAIGDKAKAISGVAISRGNVDKLSIPFWVPGGSKAVSVIKNRHKIEKLQGEQAAMSDARRRRCLS
ncbi:hypothetical protein ACX3P0_07315 [Mesorhizobium sp. A556]